MLRKDVAPGTAARGSRTIDVEEVERIPVVEEQLVPATRKVKTGSVRVDKRVQRRTETVEAPLVREQVEVRRVQVNKPVRSIPQVRNEGDTVIIPVVEEEIVVTKRLILKEEIHLVKTRTRQRTTQKVTLARETAEVTRLDGEGREIRRRSQSVLDR